jgi:hypothetical protein
VLSKTTRRIALLAMLAGLVVLVRAWLHDSSDAATSRTAPAHPPHDVARDAPQSTDALIPRSVAADARRSPSVLRSTPGASRDFPVEQAPVRIAVHAPADVGVGEVFQARIDIEASIPVRDLVFSIVYDKSRLTLVGRSEGAFVRQRGTSSEFGVDEPSDGYIEVVFRAVNDSAATGSGSIAVFEFEAIRPGTSGIELANVQSIGAGGEANRNVPVTHARVMIH